MTRTATGVVVAGHGVASGQAAGSPFAGGTIALQSAHFADRGVDLAPYVPATVNLDIAPHHLVLERPRATLVDVTWTDVHTPETFSFVDCVVRRGDQSHEGLVYLPHPETKPMHHQPATVVELLLPRLENLRSGERLEMTLAPGQAVLVREGSAESPPAG